jgi:hypothetical protein
MKIGSKTIALASIGGKAIAVVRLGAKLVWEAVRANFLTKEGFYIETSDGKVFDSKEMK